MSEMCGPDDSGEWSGEMSGDVKAATREVKRFEENGHQFHQISKVKAQKKPAFVRRTNFASNAHMATLAARSQVAATCVIH